MTTTSGQRGTSWLDLGTLPVAAAVLVALNGLYVLIVAFGNITDFGTNQAFVHHVLSMDTTNFGKPQGTDLDPNVMWRAITSPVIQNVAYIALIAWEVATAVVLVVAVVLSTVVDRFADAFAVVLRRVHRRRRRVVPDVDVDGLERRRPGVPQQHACSAGAGGDTPSQQELEL
jgi:hypothetical protein